MIYSDVICRDSRISSWLGGKEPAFKQTALEKQAFPFSQTLHPTTPLFVRKVHHCQERQSRMSQQKHFLTIITFICQIISLCFKEIARLQNTDSTTTVHVQ